MPFVKFEPLIFHLPAQVFKKRNKYIVFYTSNKFFVAYFMYNIGQQHIQQIGRFVSNSMK